MKKIALLLLAMLMVLSLCACGAKEEAPAAEAAPAAPVAAPDAAAPVAAPDPAAPAAPAEGEASGEPSGEVPAPDFYAPTDAYAKDFEGYRQYVIDAFATDPGAPEDLKVSYNASFEAMTEETMGETSVANLVDLGLICSYEEFLAY